jgi:hypothetical protein
VVTFSKGSRDSIRFNVITALKTALAGQTSGAISRKSAAAGQEVVPLFNGDDLFTDYIGLKSTGGNTFANPVIIDQRTPGVGFDFITPEGLDVAFTLLGLDYSKVIRIATTPTAPTRPSTAISLCIWASSMRLL